MSAAPGAPAGLPAGSSGGATVPGAISPEFDYDTTVPIPTIASAPEGTWRLDLNGGHPEKWTFRAPKAIETLVDTVVYDRYRFDDTAAVPEGDTGSRDDPQMPEPEGLYLTVMVTVRAKVGYIAGIVLGWQYALKLRHWERYMTSSALQMISPSR